MKIKTDSMLSKLGHINDEEFKVLFFILNTINMNSGNEHSVKIYRAVLADLCGKSERTISRITDKLALKGLIVKDSVSDGTKLYNYYSIPKQKTTSNLVTDDRVKESKEIKVYKENKEIKENKEDLKKEFEEACKSEIDWEEELDIMKEEIKTASNKKEIKQIGAKFQKLQNTYGLPTEFEDKIEEIKNLVNSKVYKLSYS